MSQWSIKYWYLQLTAFVLVPLLFLSGEETFLPFPFPWDLVGFLLSWAAENSLSILKWVSVEIFYFPLFSDSLVGGSILALSSSALTSSSISAILLFFISSRIIELMRKAAEWPSARQRAPVTCRISCSFTYISSIFPCASNWSWHHFIRDWRELVALNILCFLSPVRLQLPSVCWRYFHNCLSYTWQTLLLTSLSFQQTNQPGGNWGNYIIYFCRFYWGLNWREMDESNWKSVEAVSVPVGLCNLKSFKMTFIFSESSIFSSFYIVSHQIN